MSFKAQAKPRLDLSIVVVVFVEAVFETGLTETATGEGVAAVGG